MKKRTVLFSICGSIYILIFLAVENYIDTPYPWILYCIPPVLMWPASVCVSTLLPGKLSKIAVSWLITAAMSAYYVILNLKLSNNFPWSFIVVAALLWYPFSIMLAKKPFAFSIFGFMWSVLFFGVLNFITTPNVIWAVYPVFAVFWWPLSVFFFYTKRETR